MRHSDICSIKGGVALRTTALKVRRQGAHWKSFYKTELGDPEGEEISVPLWCGNVGAEGSPRGGSEGKPLGLAKCTWAPLFSKILSLHVHMETSEQFLISLPHLAFSGSVGSFLKPAWSDVKPPLLCRDKWSFVRSQGLGRPVFWLCISLGWSFLKSPGSHFCGRFHLVSQGLQAGWWGPLGRAHQSPTLGAICKLLLEGAQAQPRTGCPCSPPIVCRIGRLSPADLPASGEMWKVRDKNGFYRGRGKLSCTERKEIPLWDFIFFPPSSSKKYKETLCL